MSVAAAAAAMVRATGARRQWSDGERRMSAHRQARPGGQQRHQRGQPPVAVSRAAVPLGAARIDVDCGGGGGYGAERRPAAAAPHRQPERADEAQARQRVPGDEAEPSAEERP